MKVWYRLTVDVRAVQTLKHRGSGAVVFDVHDLVPSRDACLLCGYVKFISSAFFKRGLIAGLGWLVL